MVGYFSSSEMSPLKEDDDGVLPSVSPLTGSRLLRPSSPRPNHVSSSTGDKPSPVKSVVCSPDFPVFQFFPAPGRTGPEDSSGATASSTTAPPFRCTACGKVSASKSAHQNHMRAHAKDQGEEKQSPPPTPQQDPYPCTICGKTFAVPARLTRHFRTHTGEKPYQCEFCSKAFSVKENLSVHRRIHTKERPYKCEVCARAFEHSGKLHRHARIHTGERPHRCAVCGKTFIQSGQLVIHMRTHTGEKPYVCKSCGKGFTCSKQLKVHTRTHTGEKPYSCEICGKAFGYNHVLKLHQVAHFGEKVYKCTICHETFNSKKTMESHIKSHSGGGSSQTSGTPSPTETAPSPPSTVYSPPSRLPSSTVSSETSSTPTKQRQLTYVQERQELSKQQHVSSGDYDATSSSSSIGSATASSSSDKENRNCPSAGSEDSEVSRRLSLISADGSEECSEQQRTCMESSYNNANNNNEQAVVHQVVQPSQSQRQTSSPIVSLYQPQQEREVCYYVYQSMDGNSNGGIFQSVSSPSISYIHSQGPQSPTATPVSQNPHMGLSPMLLAAVGLTVEDEEEDTRKNIARQITEEVSSPAKELVSLVEEQNAREEDSERSSPARTILTSPIYLFPETLASDVGMSRIHGTCVSTPEPFHHQANATLRHQSPYGLASLPLVESYSTTPGTSPGSKRRRGEPTPLLTPPSSNPVSPAPSASMPTSDLDTVVSAPLHNSNFPVTMREVLILPPRKRSKLILEEMRSGGSQLLAPPNQSEAMQQTRVNSVIHYAEKAPTAI
nr:Kruppel homolog 1 protein isoform A [Pseudothemis zonata]